MVEATLTTDSPAEAPEDVLEREYEILALEDFKRAVHDTFNGNPPSVESLRQILFASGRTTEHVKAFVRLLRQRKAAVKNRERGVELERIWNLYAPSARQLANDMESRREYHLMMARRCEQAQRSILQKISDRRGEAIDLTASANRVLLLKTTKGSQANLRELSQLLAHRRHLIRELGVGGRFGTAEQIAMRQRIEQLEAMAAAHKHRADVREELEAKQAEYDRLVSIPARRAELEAECERIQGYMQDIRTAQASGWADIDWDLPPSAIGSQLPPAQTVDPTEQFVAFTNDNVPVFHEGRQF